MTTDERIDAGRVAAVETARVSLGAHPTLTVRGARGTHDRSDFLLVRLVTNDGVEGFGEVSATLMWSGEDADTAEAVIRRVLAPAIIDAPLLPVSGLLRRLDAAVSGHPFTKAGLETAAWDALGRRLGLRVAELLGGPHRTAVPTKLSLSGDGDDLARTLAAARERGFGAFKVKVGLEPARDIERFRLARELVGPTTFLGADANGGWTRLAAHEGIAGLLPHDPAFVEQPVHADDLRSMRACRGLGVPILADESVSTLHDVADVIAAEAADAVNVYVGMSSGLERALQAIRTASLFGLGAIIGSNGEMGLGAAAQLHVACAAEELGPFPSDIIGHHYYEEDILDTPLDIDGRFAHLPDGPGLGVRPAERIRATFA